MDDVRARELIATLVDNLDENAESVITEIARDGQEASERINQLSAENVKLAERLENTRKKYVSAVLGAKTPVAETSPTEEKPERATFDSLFK